MTDDPNQIATYLIEEQGPVGALTTVQEAIMAAHADQDNYRLSVWREVRRILRDKEMETENSETSVS